MKKILRKSLIYLLVVMMVFPAWLMTGMMGIQNVKAAVNPIIPVSVVAWNFPNNPDDTVADGGVSANSNKTITENAGSLYYTSGKTTASATSRGWANGRDSKYWQVSFSTLDFDSLKLSSVQRSSDFGPRDFKIQYSIGNGVFQDVAGGAVPTVQDNWTHGTVSDLALPAACNNQPVVNIRWIMTSNTRVGSSFPFYWVSDFGSSSIDNISLTGRDITAPTARVDYSTTDWTNGSVTATLVNTGEHYAITGLGSPTHLFTSNGSYLFTFVDDQGTTGSKLATVANIDNAPPAITSISGSVGTTGESTLVTAAVSDSESGINTVSISIDGSPYVSMEPSSSGQYNYSVNIPENSIAPVVYIIKVRDNAGNEITSAPQTISVTDNDRPTISSISSTPNTTGDVTTVTVAASDNIGIVSAMINIQGAGFVPMLGSGPYTYPYTLSNHDMTDIAFMVSFKDAQGLENDQKTYYINPVDDEAPVISLLGSNPVTVEQGSSYVDAGATALDNIDRDLTSAIVTVNPVKTNIAGDYTVTYDVLDSAGNPAKQVTRLVHVVDTTPPIITPVAPITAVGPTQISLSVADINYAGLMYDWQKVTGPGEISFNIDPLNNSIAKVSTDVNGIYVLKVTVTDPFGNSSSVFINLTWNAAFNVDSNHSDIVLPGDANGKAIIIIEPDFALGKLDLSQVLGCNTEGREGNCGNETNSNLDIELRANIGGTIITIMIPGGTDIRPIGELEWNGIIDLPAIATLKDVTLPLSTNNILDKATTFAVGLGDGSLQFNGPVSLTFSNAAGSRIGYIEDGKFIEIVQSCDSLTAPTTFSETGECKVNSAAGKDLTVWTKHFTTFSVYNEATVTAPVFTATAITTGGTKIVRVEWNDTGADFYEVSINDVKTIIASTGLAKYVFDNNVNGFGKYNVIVKSIKSTAYSQNSEIKTVEFNEVATVATPTAQVVSSSPVTTVAPISFAPRSAIAAPPDENIAEAPKSDNNGITKGTETNADVDNEINWTPWIVLFILVLLAGAATGSYFYWFAKKNRDDEDDVRAKEKKAVKRTAPKATVTLKSKPNKKGKRW